MAVTRGKKKYAASLQRLNASMIKQKKRRGSNRNSHLLYGPEQGQRAPRPCSLLVLGWKSRLRDQDHALSPSSPVVVSYA